MCASVAVAVKSRSGFNWGAGGHWQEVLERRDYLGERGIPDSEDTRILAEAGGIGPRQKACADALKAYPQLERKADRRALCGRVAKSLVCPRCQTEYFKPLGCNVRYCEECGPLIADALYEKYLGLRPVVAKLMLEHRAWHVAMLDFTAVNLGRMPTSAEVKAFKRAIRKMMARICTEMGVCPREIGFLYMLEFGGKKGPNSNLHCHGIFVGPWLPRPQLNGELKELGEWWRDACKGTVFDGRGGRGSRKSAVFVPFRRLYVTL